MSPKGSFVLLCLVAAIVVIIGGRQMGIATPTATTVAITVTPAAVTGWITTTEKTEVYKWANGTAVLVAVLPVGAKMNVVEKKNKILIVQFDNGDRGFVIP